MSTFLGGSEISEMYLGNREISEMYLGSNLIYSSADESFIMGVEWDKQADPTLTRIGDWKDFVANIGIGDEVVQNDFDQAPIYREIIRETDDLGNTFVRIPRFYIRKTDDEGLLRLEISKTQIPGSYLPKCFWDFTNSKELPYVDVGAYITSWSYDYDWERVESRSGVAPEAYMNIKEHRDYARANGPGYQQLDIHAADMLQCLFHVEFATINSQSIHPGYTWGDGAKLTGGTDGVVASSGSMGTSSIHQFMYRGIEDLWGNLWQLVDGVNINDHQAWVCEDAEQYASDVFASPYQKLSYVNASSDGYAKEMGFDQNRPYAQFPIAVGADTTTYYSDYYWQNGGQRVAMFGGDWNYGEYTGLSCWGLSDDSWLGYDALGGRLLRKPI